MTKYDRIFECFIRLLSEVHRIMLSDRLKNVLFEIKCPCNFITISSLVAERRTIQSRRFILQSELPSKQSCGNSSISNEYIIYMNHIEILFHNFHLTFTHINATIPIYRTQTHDPHRQQTTRASHM